MPRLIFVVLLGICLALPKLGHAQEGPDRPTLDRGGEILGISKENAFAIGAGVVVGALVLHLVVPADFTYFAGGVLGGFAANWWYRNGAESQVRALLKQSNDPPASSFFQAAKPRLIAVDP